MNQETQEQPHLELEAMRPEDLKRLLQISTRLSSTLHLDELLALVMDVAIQLTDTQTASILLVNQSTGQLHFAASTSGSVPADIVVPLDSSIAGWVVLNNKPVIVNNVRSDSRFYAQVDENLEFVTRSMLAVPLVTNNRVIGTLEVLNKRLEAPYTDQDVALMEALASQSAVAIMNAHLFHQSDLLSEIMHEIKTPLMAVQTASELLMHPNLPQEKHGTLIEMIRREAIRLGKMTRDFLDFARLESGRSRLAKEPVDLVRAVNEVVEIEQPQVAGRNITIVTNLATDTPTAVSPLCVIGDYDRLKQVLLNLVSNARKYNVEGGQITITTAVSGEEVRLAVSDTGKGIKPKDLGHLFERFYRIPGSENVSEGSGLGLSVAKKIVEELNGRIEVDSVVGKGTTFTIIFPLKPLPPPAPVAPVEA